MRLILFRHGPAGKRDAERWPDDDLRPLTEKGRERTRAAAQGLARVEPEIRQVWTSPLVRAAQTAEILLEVLGKGVEKAVVEDLVPGGSPRRLLERLQRQRVEGAIVLVGHETDLGELAGWLLTKSQNPLPIKKAGACALEFDGPLLPGEARLTWFLPPKLLRRLD